MSLPNETPTAWSLRFDSSALGRIPTIEKEVIGVPRRCFRRRCSCDYNAIDGVDWSAIIDTGFNGDLELSDALRGRVDARYTGQVSSALADGQTIAEDAYLVDFPFDGELLQATATFVEGAQILIGHICYENIDCKLDS